MFIAFLLLPRSQLTIFCHRTTFWAFWIFLKGAAGSSRLVRHFTSNNTTDCNIFKKKTENVLATAIIVLFPAVYYGNKENAKFKVHS